MEFEQTLGRLSGCKCQLSMSLDPDFRKMIFIDHGRLTAQQHPTQSRVALLEPIRRLAAASRD